MIEDQEDHRHIQVKKLRLEREKCVKDLLFHLFIEVEVYCYSTNTTTSVEFFFV